MQIPRLYIICSKKTRFYALDLWTMNRGEMELDGRNRAESHTQTSLDPRSMMEYVIAAFKNCEFSKWVLPTSNIMQKLSDSFGLG